MIVRGRVATRIVALACLAAGPVAATPVAATPVAATPVAASAAGIPAAAREAHVAAIFDAIAQDPERLRLFLRRMPKGGDLHNHLGGGTYAEDILRWAAADGLCVAATALVPPPCPAGQTVASVIEHQPETYARLVDALSTRGWQQGVGRDTVSGHDQFFATFDRFGAAAHGHDADALVLARRAAADDRLSYLELDHNPSALDEDALAVPATPLDAAGLAERYARDLPGIDAVVDRAIAETRADEAKVRTRMGCTGAQPEAGCGVGVRYMTYALRAMPAAVVFRQLMLGFALAQKDPRFVGVNIVQPEDWPVPLRDYDLHMAMFRFLESKYPGVHRSLHAGELAPGMVPPTDLRDHIAKAIAVGGAQRIGHGVDIADEADAAQTMSRMAHDGIAVEINLSSNDVILGIRGADHPLALYRRFGVPFVISSDDQGVLRGDMTGEYLRAAREQGLRYRDLKTAARASLEYAFLPGEGVWRAHRPGLAKAACARSMTDAGCRALAASSEKAQAELLLEQQLADFEDRMSIDPV